MGEFQAHPPTRCGYWLFSRHHGVSRDLFASLNVGCDVGDQKDAVRENRRKVKEMVSVPFMLSSNQVHGTGVYCLKDPLADDKDAGEADALITDLPGVGLMIQQADCQAVLLFDPKREVIAAVHCGWRGSVQGILERVISAMRDNYGTVPADLQAVISPSLGPCCAEFINYRDELPSEYQQFMVRDNYFDFWSISKDQLINGGMSVERIRTAEICTCCSRDYFSYRQASRYSGGITGRQCSVIALKQE